MHQQLTPNATEQSTRQEEQWRGGSTFRASMAEQIVVGGDVPGAVVVKMRNQWVMEYYSIVAKLKQDSAGVEDHRNTLATTKRSRRGHCRPRGRRARTASFW